ncbi:branched-chain amino acid ABC transporter substrate-binding protein [Paraburkholderia sp. DHOC27]|uniref:branched-chain amino acid ABC transporter substrate-binding protein n=1 Tax=Paraburkholderia sp. DHOC27 TaxID=2303330 RepID=UPI000E3C6F85|nr:branched-chain amino acid ABC transporter substrate-binding protein [Paraburkholderia sp. DHOC27]RFU48283.1 branched-chain amino acid ABC transporter substrate-binding protein [Paraburkholderia sp. DHOC27]
MKMVRSLAAGAAVVFALASAVASAETVRIAYIDTLSGLMGSLGNNELKSWQYVTEVANQQDWAGGPKFEMVPFDNKLSPQQSLTLLNEAADQGIRYITQGNGSSVGLALEDAVSKYNARNPGKEIIYLNFAAVDPAMTNAKCDYWHFRLDANSDMKMEALTTFLAKDPNVKKVYLIDQDYSFGHDVSRTAQEYLKRKRPDIQIVGDDFHPLAQVKDFSPYASKIKASGADTVITGNWGSDLALLIKAGKDAGVTANYYTYYASTTGVPTAMGAAGAGHVRYVGYMGPNTKGNPPQADQIMDGFKKKYDDDFFEMAAYTGVALLSKAFKETKSTDPVKVAKALEGMKVESLNGTVEMRASDHQAEQPLVIATWVKVDGKDVKYDQEKTGYGWRTETVLDAASATQPTTCQMKRPN